MELYNGLVMQEAFCTGRTTRIWSDFTYVHISGPGYFWEESNINHVTERLPGLGLSRAYLLHKVRQKNRKRTGVYFQKASCITSPTCFSFFQHNADQP